MNQNKEVEKLSKEIKKLENKLKKERCENFKLAKEDEKYYLGLVKKNSDFGYEMIKSKAFLGMDIIEKGFQNKNNDITKIGREIIRSVKSDIVTHFFAHGDLFIREKWENLYKNNDLWKLLEEEEKKSFCYKCKELIKNEN